MKTFRISAVLTMLILICSGCAANSGIPAANTQAQAAASSSAPTTAATATDALLSSAPAADPADTGTAHSASPRATAFTLFNENNFTDHFHFGMSGKEVENELKGLGITDVSETRDSSDSFTPPGFYSITDEKSNVSYLLNDKDQLYCIWVSRWIAAISRSSDDYLNQMHKRYGKEDEYDDCWQEYSYYKKGYIFTVSPSQNYWSVSVDVWNDPNAFSSPHKLLGKDDPIKLNENNYSNYFQFDMSRQTVEKVLAIAGVRITREMYAPSEEDSGRWVIYTDHLAMGFDDKNGLDSIIVMDWGTARGLKKGDSVDKLHQLYGKEDKLNDAGDYTYQREGYVLDFGFLPGDSGGPLELSSWSISTNSLYVP